MSMVIGFGRPTITWTVSGTGAGIVSGLSNLADGRPGTITRFNWISGAQTTSSVFHLRGDWSTSLTIPPGLVGFSNISLPVGTKVTVSFRRAADTAGTYPYSPTAYNNPQRIVAGPRGERTLWILLPAGATNVCGVDFAIANDVNGSATIVASSLFTIGDAVMAQAAYVDIDQAWGRGEVDSTTDKFSWDEQPFTVAGTVKRNPTFSLLSDPQEVYFGDPSNLSAVDYEELFAQLDRGQTGIYIPRWQDATGAFSAQMLHRMAMMGVLTKLPQFSHAAGPKFTSSQFTVAEAPIPT